MTQQNFPKEIAELIGRLRGRIRSYVWIEGFAVAFIWLGLTFWVGLALDYLPVMVGASEMPVAARIFLLVVISGVLAWILYRWILRRAFVSLQGESLALLIERQFPQFNESLVTTVELSKAIETDPTVNQNMFSHTQRMARENVADVNLSKVFNYGPMLRSVSLAVLAVGSIVLFGFMAKDAFGMWVNRMYRLSDEPWPRRASIEVVGFEDHRLKVAEGSDTTIRVVADAKRAIPKVCTIVYESDNGDRGRVNMRKNGEVRDGYQHYVFEQAPFKGMLDSVTFDVVGFDHRVRDFRVEAVPSPAIIDVSLICELPAYTKLLGREEKWSVGTRLPIGTKVTVVAQTNKPIDRVELVDVGASDAATESVSINDDRTSFVYEIGNLKERIAKHLTLFDTDKIQSEQPFRLTIGAIEDQVPTVSMLLKGIGDAITPNAIIQMEGKIDDDYEVEKAWIDISIREPSEVRTFPISKRTELEEALDLQEEANRESPVEGKSAFVLQPGQEIDISVRAKDLFDLNEKPNIGVSEEYPLRVVEPSELLALLEARELELRRRFEHVISEMTDVRGWLVRLRPGDEPKDTEPNDARSDDSDEKDESSESTDLEAATESESTALVDQQKTLRKRLVTNSQTQGEKSTEEINGIVQAFDGIRQQLINNRIDSKERQDRIENQIVEPLKDIIDLQFPDWHDTLKTLEGKFDSDEDSDVLIEHAIGQTDDILLAMERILQKMEELESYNELVDLVRSIIKQQEDLLEKTKDQQKKQAKSLLE